MGKVSKEDKTGDNKVSRAVKEAGDSKDNKVNKVSRVVKEAGGNKGAKKVNKANKEAGGSKDSKVNKAKKEVWGNKETLSKAVGDSSRVNSKEGGVKNTDELH